MTSPKVAIIILNWNGLKDTIECLGSLKKITYPNYQIIVVDNGSKGNEADVLQEKYKNYIKVIRNKENLGFAGGNNVAIREVLKKGKSEHILLLNNDTVVEPNFLDELVKTAESDSKVGIVGGKILYYNDPNKIWYAGGKLDLIRGSGYHFQKESPKKEREVTFITGCLMLIKKEVLEKIGLLSEEYFLVAEDVDYSYRYSRAGFKLKVNNNAVIYHKISSTLKGTGSPIEVYYNTRNRVYFMTRKIRNPFYILTFFIFFLLSRIIKIFQFLASNQFGKITFLVKGFLDGFKRKLGKTNLTSL